MPGDSRQSAARKPLELRAATTSDAERIARGVIDGFRGYRSFAPPGWKPPSLAEEVELLRGLLGDPQVWCLLAEVEGELAGQITLLPATRAVQPVDDRALAHLRTLFVRRDLWGSGLASTLHAAAVQAARERGFASMRLFTPVAHGRARRFYEREGWRVAGEEFHAAGPDLTLVEYRLALAD